MRFRLLPKSVTWRDLERRNGHYFALFYQIHVYDIVVKKFTFAISFPDEFLVLVLTHVTLHMHHCRFTHSLFITTPLSSLVA